MNDYLKRAIITLDKLSALKRAGMFNPNNARILLSAHIKKDPSRELAMIDNAVLLSKMFRSPFDIPDNSVNGLIKFALTEQGLPIGIFPEECHHLICGQTGTGKSTLLKILFSQALLFNKFQNVHFINTEKLRCWLFVKAQDMRNLLNVDRNILVVNFNMIKLNPLEPPPGMRSIEWASIFADIWIQAFRLYEGSKGFLIECLNNLYVKYNSLGYYPSLFDLYNYVMGLKFPLISRSARYQESVLNRLGGLIHGSLGSVFDCSKGHISSLINLHVIFEIIYLAAEQQVFMVNYLLSYLFNYKLIQKTSLRHFVGIDDANLIFDIAFEKRPDLGLPIIHHLLTTVRKNKINVFACTQTPHQVGASIHSNSFAKIMFSLSHGKDIECMQQSMGIKDREQKAYCYRLKPREAVVKFSARYQEPFIATVPEINL